MADNKKLDGQGLSQVWANIVENFVSRGVLTDELIEKLKDAYTKDETEEAITEAVRKEVTGVYKVKGSTAFASLPEEGMKPGDVYNVTDEFTAGSNFVETEVGKKYPAGTNVVYTENGWDAMAGVFDFSDFMMKSELENLTEEEINAICVMPEV